MVERRILIVDDDPELLAAIRRRLGRKYKVTSVMHAEPGAGDHGPYALAISGDRPWSSDGISSLRRLRRGVPETIRILQAGSVEDTVTDVFRFIPKPCRFEDIVASIELAFRSVVGSGQPG